MLSTFFLPFLALLSDIYYMGVNYRGKLSNRLREIVDALPLFPGARVLEIGCGPGAAAREIAERISEEGYILAIDRSARAIQQAMDSLEGAEAKNIRFLQLSSEQLELPPEEELFDIAFAVRVGAFDGRHPEVQEISLRQVAKALRPEGKFYIDGGNPLREIFLDSYR